MRIIRRLGILAAIIALAAVGAWALAGRRPQPAAKDVFTGEHDEVRASLDHDAGLRTLRGTQSLTITNRTATAMQDIVLRLAMNAREENAIQVSNVKVNGQKAAYATDEEDATVLRIAHGIAPGETLEVTFALLLRYPRDGGGRVTLPQTAMAENGAWRTDPYDELVDVSYAPMLDCEVVLDGGICLARTGVRDVTFALPGSAAEHVRRLEDVQVRILASKGAGQIAACAGEALKALKDIGLPYPYDELTLVDAGTARAEGEVYSGLIVLNTDTDRETLRRRIIRLLARQTFGILVENDPWHAPWLSETLAACAEMLTYRRLRGEAAYEERLFGDMELAGRVTRPRGVTVGAGTAHFGGDAEMTQVLQEQGAGMLLGIEQAVGEEAFLRALSAYAARNAGGTATASDLADALEEVSGSSWDGYLADGLSG